MSHTSTSPIHTLRVATAPFSKAEGHFRGRAGIIPAALAPGFHATARHDLIYHGGRTLSDLKFFNFFVGGAAAWAASDIKNINTALAAAMTDAHLNNVVQQYFHTAITSEFLGSSVLAGAPPSTVSQGDVEALVTRLFTAGSLPHADLSITVFNFLLPSGTVLNDNAAVTAGAISASVESHDPVHHPLAKAIPKPDEADSGHGLGGYHGSVNIGSQTVYYAVGVYSERRADGTINGIPAFAEPWKNVVATFYHELVEARTDPDVAEANRTNNIKLVGWTSRQGEEIGDFPVFEARPLTAVFKEVPLTNGHGTVPIQLMYSNAVHGPEGPIARPH